MKRSSTSRTFTTFNVNALNLSELTVNKEADIELACDLDCAKPEVLCELMQE